MSVVSTSPPDITALLTSFAILSVAIAAAVSGIWRGLQEIKKGRPTGHAVAAAALIETSTLTLLSESNKQLAESLDNVLPVIVKLERALERMCDEIPSKEMRERGLNEEMHRLRVAVTDLHERIRAQRI